MKTLLKCLGIFLLLAILIYAALCYFGPKNFNTDEVITVEAPASVVFNLVNSLQKSALWNDWSLTDSTMQTEYNDIATGVGAESSWSSATQGKGTQKIVESVKNQKVSTQLEFEGWDGVNNADFLLTESGKNTDLRWTFESGSDVPFLMRGFFMVLGMKGSMKNSYRAGLENIKRIAEERAKKSLYSGYTIQLKELGERNYVVKRGVIPMENSQQFYSNSLASLFALMQKSGLEMDGRPCGLYYDWNFESGTADMAAAIPITDPISIEGATTVQMPEGSVIQVDYYGDSEGSAAAHFAIEEYMNDNSFYPNMPIVEEYITDASTEEDPAKWLTRITCNYSE